MYILVWETIFPQDFWIGSWVFTPTLQIFPKDGFRNKILAFLYVSSSQGSPGVADYINYIKDFFNDLDIL